MRYNRIIDIAIVTIVYLLNYDNISDIL